MAEEAFACPFCGAPSRGLVPVGVVQVNCSYCGSVVLVPPRLGGVVQRCPNHPDVLAVGLCNDCSKSYCDRCLYVFEVEHGKLHICSKCYERRNGSKKVWAVFSIVLSAVFLITFFGVLSTPLPPTARSPLPFLATAITFLALSAAFYSNSKKKPLSVHDRLARAALAPSAFLKKCVRCGREIPIASEECQYCEAEQPPYVEA